MQHSSDLVHLDIINDFDSLPDLHKHIECINVLDPTHLRPSWDQYFMVWAFTVHSQDTDTFSDARLTGVSSFQLYEAPSWCSFGTGESYHCDGVITPTQI